MRSNEPRPAAIAPWIAGFALGALALALLRPGHGGTPAEQPRKEEPPPPPQPQLWYRPEPAPAPARETARPPTASNAREGRVPAESERSAMRAAVRNALARIRPETYFEQKAGLLYNTVSDCQITDQTWPTEANPTFRVLYTCHVVNEDLVMHERTFELRGTVEKQDDQWQASF